MDKFLGQDIPEQERWQFLQDNADAVEKIGYTHRFTPEELAQKKETLAEVSICSECVFHSIVRKPSRGYANGTVSELRTQWYRGGIGRRYVDFRDRFVNGRIWIFNQNTYHAGSSPAGTTN